MNQPVSASPPSGRPKLIVVEAAPLPAAEPRRRTASEWIVAILCAAWRFCKTNPGWGVSIALHTLIAVLVGIVAIRSDNAPRDLGIESGFGVHEIDLPFDQIGQGESVEVAAPESASNSLNALADALRSGGEGQVTGESGDLLKSIGRGTGTGAGTGEGDGDGADPGLGAAFFGTKGGGRTFVYIVDMSSSMAGRRFKRAVEELVASVQKLKPEQQFYVFFFSDQSYPLFYPRPAKGLLPATKSNRDKATRWIRTRDPGGFTNPALALQSALGMKPDVIFFLTDGEIDRSADLREMILRYNKGSTIHTIAFENEDGAVTLEAIARENKGSFRFVR